MGAERLTVRPERKIRMKNTKSSGRNRSLRAFGSAFMLTLCLLLLGCGFLVVDYNTNKMTFGEAYTRSEYRIKDGLLVLDSPDGEWLDLPENYRYWTGMAWNLLPATWRASVGLTQAEREMVPELLEQWAAFSSQKEKESPSQPGAAAEV